MSACNTVDFLLVFPVQLPNTQANIQTHTLSSGGLFPLLRLKRFLSPFPSQVLQFDQIASCLGGVFVALPRPVPAPTGGAVIPASASAYPSSCSTQPPSSSSSSSSSPSSPLVSSERGTGSSVPHPPSAASQPVVSAFWHSFSFSSSDGRKHTMRGLPAPVVRRAVERIVRDLRQRGQQKSVGGGQEEEQPAVLDESADGGDASYDVHEGKGSDEAGDGDGDPCENGSKGVSCDEEAGTTRSGIGLDGAKESLGAAPCLPLHLVTVELSKARAGLGLSEIWSKKVEDKCRDRQKQVRLSRVVRRHLSCSCFVYSRSV